MVARWKFDHAELLVEVILEGDTSAEEATRFFDELEAADAVPYDKLFDALEATPKIDEKIMGIVGRRIASYRSDGLIAVVVPGTYFDGIAKLFLLAVDLSARARVFRSVAEARHWLATVVRTKAEPEPTTQ